MAEQPSATGARARAFSPVNSDEPASPHKIPPLPPFPGSAKDTTTTHSPFPTQNPRLSYSAAALLRPKCGSPIARSLAAAAAAAAPAWAHLRRLSTEASRPPWALIHNATPVSSPALRSTLMLTEPPCTSHLLVPSHLINPRLHPDSASQPLGVLGGMVRATSGDGLLLLQFVDGTETARSAARLRAELRAAPGGEIKMFNMDPDITRFVCNPLSGELFRLPDIDGRTRK